MSAKVLTFTESKGITGVYETYWKVKSNFGEAFGTLNRARFGRYRRWCYKTEPGNDPTLYSWEFLQQLSDKVKELEGAK